MKSTIVLAAAVALLAACAERPAEDEPAAEEPAPAMGAAAMPDPAPCQVPGMRNCTQTGDLFFGSQPSPEALEALAAQGVTTVVTTRADGEVDWDEQSAVEAMGMRYVSIPMPNPVSEITDAQVAQLDSVLAGLDGPALLHCGSGNRVSGLWAAWLAEEDGKSAEEALRLAELAGMRSVRPAVERRLGVDTATP
jgi:uncharacterized protein (TIGR01244 family)